MIAPARQSQAINHQNHTKITDQTNANTTVEMHSVCLRKGKTINGVMSKIRNRADLLKKSDDGSTATAYTTESQLFPKKCEVKLLKHLNHRAGKSRNFLKNGQDLRSRIRAGQFNNLRTRCTQKSQGYGQFKMRKFLMILVAVIGFGISANAQSSDLLAHVESTSTSTSTYIVDVLVYANNAADELCNYFNGSWVDRGLKIYCAFGGDVYTCTAYKVVKGMCAINGAIKLSIEGNYDAGLRSLLSGATDILVVSKVAGQRNAFKLTKR